MTGTCLRLQQSLTALAELQARRRALQEHLIFTLQHPARHQRGRATAPLKTRSSFRGAYHLLASPGGSSRLEAQSLNETCRPVLAAEAPEQEDDSDAVEKDAVEKSLFTTLCRLHADLSKPSKLTDRAKTDAPKPDAQSDLDLDLEADPMTVDRAPSLAGEASNAGSEFEDLLGGDFDAEDGDEMLLDALSDHIAREDEGEAFLFDEAWSDSDGEGMLDMDSDSFDD